MTETATSELTPQNEEVELIAARASAWPAQAEAVVIHSDEDYQRVIAEALGIKALSAEIDSTFGPMEKAAKAALDSIRDEKKKHKVPLEKAEAIYKSRIAGWDTKQRELARIEAERAEKEERERRAAAEREEAEARKAEQEAKVKREAAEKAKRIAEEEALKNSPEAIEAAQKAQEEADAAQKAEEEAADKKAKAEAKQLEPVPIPEPAKAAKPKGASIRRPWKARVTDPELLLKAIASGQVSRKALKDDPFHNTWLTNQAKANQEELNIPGVEAYQDVQVGLSKG